MHKGTEIRQQLRNQSLEDILVDSINTVGDRIFPDDLAVIDMLALEQIAKAWQSTHTLAFGNCLPNSGAIQEGILDGSGIEPGDNQVIEVVAISMGNAGGAPITISIQLGDLVLFGGAIPPTGTNSSELGGILPLTLSKGLSLKFIVTGGTSSDFSAKVAYTQSVV